MAKIRIALKNDIYTLMLILSAIFLAIGIFFGFYRLNAVDLADKSVEVRSTLTATD